MIWQTIQLISMICMDKLTSMVFKKMKIKGKIKTMTQIEGNQKIKYINKSLKNLKCIKEIDNNNMSKISMLQFS